MHFILNHNLGSVKYEGGYKKASSSVLAAQLLLVHTALLLSCGLTGWALQRIEGTGYILEHLGNSVAAY